MSRKAVVLGSATWVPVGRQVLSSMLQSGVDLAVLVDSTSTVLALAAPQASHVVKRRRSAMPAVLSTIGECA